MSSISKSKKPRYQKLDQIDHVLKRSDLWLGSNKPKKSEEYIAEKSEDSGYKIYKKSITFPPALLRIFIEVLSNAIDNFERSKTTKTKCTKISIKIDKESGETMVWNDGDVIPIEVNDEGVYNHSMIFGTLLSGSNFDDDEERFVSGKNGVGSKGTNIFSTKFKVRGFDPNVKKILTQEWTTNMRETKGPIVKDSKLAKGFTEITYTPDFEKFGVKGYTNDVIALYTKYILDAAMLCGVKIELNDEVIPIKNLSDYSKLYENPTDEKLYIKYKTSEMLLTPCDDFQAISFVNGICTKQGGQHVDAWCEAIFRPLLDKFNKKGKPALNITNIKQYFRIFVVATVDKPVFSSQEKEKLESPSLEVNIKATEINKIMKWSVGETIQDFIRSKEMVVLKKAEKKSRGYVKIEGLDPANNAGGKFSADCSLILCEGLSAKTYAVAGIEKGVYGKSGRNWYGILALRGKLLNCRNASPAMIAKNNEITNIIKALGLRHEVDYTDDKNYKQLNYGKVILMTDADVDGLHIEGLVMNFFHSLFPSLMEREEPYIIALKTPIVRVFKKSKDILFYDERRFKEYASKQTTKFEKKYYKGLGTTKPEDVPDTFGSKIVEYITDDNLNVNMNKVFHKKHSDDRKQWLADYKCDNYVSLDDGGEIVQMNMSDFIDGEMIKFSIDDCARNIPCGIDGLKVSQRKVLYAVKKKNLKFTAKSLKVAQLGGYVAEHTNYHHGEQNLYDTIVKMANEYVGSNNIPLLYRDGMFSTRLNGKDAASARYIYTKMDMLTHLIFRQEDDVLLKYVIDDGDQVEPKFYIPIIPMILVNGCTVGIGSGWSCSIPNYNPLDLINCIKIWLNNGFSISTSDGRSDLIPWYRGFTGNIQKSGTSKFITNGIITEGKKDDEKIITELPIGMWTDKFKENLEDLLELKQIKSMKNYSTPKTVNFSINKSPTGIELNSDNLKLHSYLYTSNMVLFTQEERLKKYNQVDDIIDDFCKVRYEYYIKRKQHQINELETEIKFLGNKERFVNAVMDNTLNVMNVPENEIIKELEHQKYDNFFGNKETVDDLEDEPTASKGYDYLLRLQIRTFTKEKVRKLKNDIASKIEDLNKLKATSEKDIWLSELEEFALEYQKFLKVMEQTEAKSKKSKK